MIEKKYFGNLSDGREVYIYTLASNSGVTLKVIPYGCRIIELWTKDKDGGIGDVVLGHRTLPEYFGGNYHGSFVGRYANRIGKATFEIDGERFFLNKNDGENSLHGGMLGCHQVLWNVEHLNEGGEPSITFSHTSADGDGGYPGELKMEVQYTLTDNCELVMEYRALTDKKTAYNPTNHAFFNLSGDFQKKVYDTQLMIAAGNVTASDKELIPTGEIVPVSGTGLDFTVAKPIGKDIKSPHCRIADLGGFDHNFCVDGEGLRLAATVYDESSGRLMEVFSDMPGIQLYTFNNSDGALGKDGKPMQKHSALCLETQYYPDSVNHPNFPFRMMEPNLPFYSKTVYRFSTK